MVPDLRVLEEFFENSLFNFYLTKSSFSFESFLFKWQFTVWVHRYWIGQKAIKEKERVSSIGKELFLFSARKWNHNNKMMTMMLLSRSELTILLAIPVNHSNLIKSSHWAAPIQFQAGGVVEKKVALHLWNYHIEVISVELLCSPDFQLEKVEASSTFSFIVFCVRN